jgi:S-(hydroxymethyl)glutathione dehydrogenase/alcohol dehydrogenase
MESTAAIIDETIGEDEITNSPPATVETIKVPEPTGEEVLVEVTAASLCHTDVAIARGHIDEQLPMVMGHEGAGRVRATGSDVESVQPDDQVVLGRITCGRCQYCRAGNGQLCIKREQAKHEGSLRTGKVRFSRGADSVHHCHGVSSFSEYTIVDEEVAVKITDELTAEEATLLGCGVFTGAGAVINTADIAAGSSIVVFGAGGVGLSAVQGARIRGAEEIIAVDIVPEKLGVAESVGATKTIDSSSENVVDQIHSLTDGGADYCFEVVGHPTVTEQAVESLSPTGEAVLVGIPPAGKRDVQLDLYDMVTSEKSVIGSFNGSYSLPIAIPTLANFAADGDLLLEPLISDTKSLTELNTAMDELETGTGIRQVIQP